jgi:4-diphosphocytidyl-2-C-methyl-D-erythritol kinase
MKNTCFAPAKINLYLRIVGRRTDGYHDIETLFQRIALQDRLTIEEGPIGGSPFRLAVIGEGLEDDDLDKNLVARAWEELSLACPFAMGPVRVVLDKRIPVGAGLGGGSSDAASTLMALRDMFSLPLDNAALRSIGARLGADVPFFLGPPCAIGRGIGDDLTPAEHSSQFWVVLAFPPFGVSTRKVYQRYDPAAPHEAADLEPLLESLRKGDAERTIRCAYNEMESPAFGIRPDLGDLRRNLEALAGRPVRMSGSGSTLFTLFGDEEEARIAAERICQERFPGIATLVTTFHTEK